MPCRRTQTTGSVNENIVDNEASATGTGINSWSQTGYSSPFRDVDAYEGESWAQTDPTLDADGEGVEFYIPRGTCQMWVGLREDVMPAGNPPGMGDPPVDWWEVSLLTYAFYFHYGEYTFSIVYGDEGANTVTEASGSFEYVSVEVPNEYDGTKFGIWRDGDQWRFLKDDVTIFSAPVLFNAARVTAIGNSNGASPDFNEPNLIHLTRGTITELTAGIGTEGAQSGDDCSPSWTMPTPTAFPFPAVSSILYSYFDELEPDWGEHGQEMGDGKPVHNTIQTAQVRRWVVEWEGLDETQAGVLDAHYESTRGGLSFSFTNPRTAEVLTGVRYEEYTLSSHTRIWSQNRRAKLVRYTS